MLPLYVIVPVFTPPPPEDKSMALVGGDVCDDLFKADVSDGAKAARAVAIAMSCNCGFSRCTAMSRFRSRANFTASSSVSPTTGPWPGTCTEGDSVSMVAVFASRISSLMRSSLICACAGALARKIAAITALPAE
jgi:hypothetical protein